MTQPERRLEDHLPAVVVMALKEEQAETGWTLREIVLWAIARELLHRGLTTRSRARLEQVHQLMTLLLAYPEEERRRASERTTGKREVEEHR